MFTGIAFPYIADPHGGLHRPRPGSLAGDVAAVDVHDLAGDIGDDSRNGMPWTMSLIWPMRPSGIILASAS